MRLFVALTPLLCLSIILAACGDKGVPPLPDYETGVEIISGNNQSPQAGAFLVDSLLVRVLNEKGVPLEGVEVRFEQITPVQGGHFVWTTPRTTNSLGYARNKYYADTQMGLDSIMATAAGVDDSVVYFTVNVAAAAADTIYMVSGNNQTGVGGQKLPLPCVVRVDDRYGNPVPNHRVKFKTYYRCLVETDSTALLPHPVDSAFTRTDTDGEASAEWIMTVNPEPYSQSFPNCLPTMKAFNEVGDSIRPYNFVACATSPGQLKYYYNIRNIFEEHCFLCHAGVARGGGYALDFLYEVADNGNLNPTDSTAPLLDYLRPDDHYADSLDWISQDLVINWIVAHDTAHGSSGKNNYNDHMKAIFNSRCATSECHTLGGSVYSNYILSSHTGIRGGGEDATANALRGDSASLLVQKLLSGGNMRAYLGVDSTALADSIIRWVVQDSLRDY